MSIETRLVALEERAAAQSDPSNCPSCDYAWGYRVVDVMPLVTRCFRCNTAMPDGAPVVKRLAGVSAEDL